MSTSSSTSSRASPARRCTRRRRSRARRSIRTSGSRRLGAAAGWVTGGGGRPPAGEPEYLAAEWRAAFAGARSAVQPPPDESAAIAAFGLRVIGGRAGLTVRRSPGEAAVQRTLAATLVGL